MSGLWIRILVAVLATAGAVPAGAQAPPQPPPKPHHTRPARTLPTPPNALVDQGLSLEHECLNAVGATRRTEFGDEARRAAAAEHLDQAEEEAHAGRGQACQDELGAASEYLK